MMKNIKCTINSGERQSKKSVNQFVQCIFQEDRRVKELHAQEIQSTAENPKIKAENETIDISEELKEYKREKFLEQKRRQQLRENEQELRQLQMQLRAAYVSKAIIEQKAVLDRAKEQQRTAKLLEEENAEKERNRAREALREQEEKERRKKEQFREILQAQMSAKNERKKQEYREILKDKEEMTKVTKQMAAEQEQERRDSILRKEQAKKDMDIYKKLHEANKWEKYTQKKEEHEKTLAVIRERDEEQKRMQEEKRRALEHKMALSERIGRELFEIQNEKRKRERLLLDLLVEELKTKNDLRFRQNAEQALMQRAQATAELERYTKDIRREKDELLIAEEQLMLKETQKLIDEANRAERIKEEQKKYKEKVHRQALLDMIEMRRDQKAKNTAEVLQEYEILLNEQRKKDQQIEDERIRLLKAHPPEVLRYLPVGALRESDRAHLPLIAEASRK